ncbi:MAG: 5-methyltetrahydropteroyltriglutamate--homocysteine S-methyltransferase [Spirosomataceae bacterium]
MLKNNLGYPRIGSQRQLKKACEAYWSGKISSTELAKIGRQIRVENWGLQKDSGIDLIPSNDFSFYDQVLDHCMLFQAIPKRFETLRNLPEIDLYFAMARGYQKDGHDIKAMEMTKWFDTNYHYLVPEFTRFQTFKLNAEKILSQFLEAKSEQILTKPVLIGPVSFLLLGKEKESGFHRLDLIERLLPAYLEVISRLVVEGVEWIQFDEPFLAMDIDYKTKESIRQVYHIIRREFPNLKIMVATYFEGLQDNVLAAVNLPICALHIDLVRGVEQLDEVLAKSPKDLSISLGVIDGRNIWKNDYEKSALTIEKAIKKKGLDRVMIAPSCSLIHSPVDLDNEKTLNPEIKNWMAFAKQKLQEIDDLYKIVIENDYNIKNENQKAINSRISSTLIHNPAVKKRVSEQKDTDLQRNSSFAIRQQIQKSKFNLPLFPTTTIGSFPQTDEIRGLRAKFKKGEISENEYNDLLREHTKEVIVWQESIGLDVLVHGEYERNDMVEYFGEQLNGYVFTQNGWVQSYGSRCVKPPIIFGDIDRKAPMTVEWSVYAQSVTTKPMKGMLTGPITILQWSFVRDDQPRHETMKQIAWAIRDEVKDLEKAGIGIIQIDEAALREGLPLRQSKQKEYLKHTIEAFRIASSGVSDQTQIHTHMCYSEFNNIIDSIADMDADVITIETSRSQMELLDAFAQFDYPNEIGPGVYDIHSPSVPTQDEMVALLKKAQDVIKPEQLWVNPDCGLKTRKWSETKPALIEMVNAAKTMRASIVEGKPTNQLV